MDNSVKPFLASKRLYNNRSQQKYEKDIFMDFALRIGISEFLILQPYPPKPDIIVSIFRSDVLEELKKVFEVNKEGKSIRYVNSLPDWMRFSSFKKST